MMRMTKSIKFPLEMAAGVKVNTIEELWQWFDMEKLLNHYYVDRLLKWLECREYKDEFNQIKLLDNSSPDFNNRLIEIFFQKIKDVKDTKGKCGYMEYILKVKEKNQELCK